MNLEDITVNELSKAEIDKSYRITLVRGSYKGTVTKAESRGQCRGVAGKAAT